MRYYFQVNPRKERDFVDQYVFSAYLGCEKVDYTGKRFFFDDINEVPVSDDVMVIGFIPETIHYMKELGIGDLKPLNVPTDLFGYLHRDIKIVTLGEIRKDSDKFIPGFFKPNDVTKQFLSGTLKKKISIADSFHDLADETNVFWSELVDIETEYRCFVNSGKVIGMKHYQGDFNKFIDPEVVNEMVNKFSNAPISYTLDVGLCNGKTIIIECNDGWAVADYGLAYEQFFPFLRDRWCELLNKIYL